MTKLRLTTLARGALGIERPGTRLFRASAPRGLASNAPWVARGRAWRVRLAIAATSTMLAFVGPVPAGAATPLLPNQCTESIGIVTCTYTSGDNSFTVPIGVTTIHAVAIGGRGGIAYDPNEAGSFGGLGARVSGDLVVTPGSTLYASVATNGQPGATGWPGGGSGGEIVGQHVCHAGGGGGASDVRTDATIDSRILVAGGGGGAGCPGWDAAGNPIWSRSNGGNAGDPGQPDVTVANLLSGTGGEAGCVPPATTCGRGGSGAAPIQADPASAGAPGLLLSGGHGATGGYTGGGGGGGWWGGGGGGGGTPTQFSNSPYGPGGGGGGGSSLVPAGGTVELDGTGVPEVAISYSAPIASTFNVLSAASTGPTSMTITYDQAPDALAAVTLANYSVPGLTLSGTPTLTGSVVTIATSAQSAQGYTVTVSNVARASDATPLMVDTASFTGTQPIAPPVAGVSPVTMAFGSVRVGTPSTSQQLTVTNTAAVGAGGLHVGQLAVTGANASDFGIGNDLCSNTTLAPSASCTALVTFIPSARGARSAAVQVPDDASGSPQSVALSGTGVAPVAQVTPASIDFGTVNVGATSGHQTVTITNTGDPGQNLLLTSETITGANASDFTFLNDTCFGNFIAAGTSCTIDYTFTPSAAGLRSATVTITDNGLNSPHSVSLTGTGGTPSADLAAGISASPNPVKSGSKVTYTITIFNAGPSTARTILINDSLSSQSTFVSATISQGSCVTPVKGASGVVSCSLASLASGASQPIQIVVTVIAKKNAITNTVTVSAATADPVLANNTASITTRVK